MRTYRFAAFMILTGLLLQSVALISASGCVASATTPTPQPPPRSLDAMVRDAKPIDIVDAMHGGPVQRAVATAMASALDSIAPSDVYAATRYLWNAGPGCSGPTRPRPFTVAGVVPNAAFEIDVLPGPISGREFRVVWFTSALPVPPSPTPDLVWVMVGHNGSFIPRPAPWPGCVQMIEPDAIVPIAVATGWQGAVLREPGSDGRIELRWTPDAGMVGNRVQLQLLVFATGITTSGFDLSQGVDLTVGTR